MAVETIIAHLKATARKLTGATPLDVAIMDGSGNQIVNFGGSGGTASTDESAFTAGAGSGTPAMGLFETVPTTVASGQVGVLGMTNDRKLKISGSFSSTPVTSATLANSSVVASVTSVTLLAANAARLAFELYNDSTATAYVAFAATATTSAFIKRMAPGEYFRTSDIGVNWIGIITAIWDAANGNMRVNELTA